MAGRVKGIRIRPEKKGLRATLFDLEADIMEVVWKEGWESFTVADVQRALGRRRPLAYTTVMTTVGRLFDKGLLAREREGRRYVYRAAMSRTGFADAMARELFESLSSLDQAQAMALLADRISGSDADALAALEAQIRRRREELEG